jgi:hypothetical protein
MVFEAPAVLAVTSSPLLVTFVKLLLLSALKESKTPLLASCSERPWKAVFWRKERE